MLGLGTSYMLVNLPTNLTCSQKSGRDRSENSASSFQVWHGDGNPFSKYKEIWERDETAFKYGKLEREVQNQRTSRVLLFSVH